MKRMNKVGQARSNRLAAVLCLIGSVLAIGGCYEHVVSAKGFANDGVTVHERQTSNTWIDRQIFGDAEPKVNSKVVRQE